MLEPVRYDPEGERLNPGLGLGSSLAVSQDARQLRHFGDPAAVLLPLDLNLESHPLPGSILRPARGPLSTPG